jgi:hypothetical protein
MKKFLMVLSLVSFMTGCATTSVETDVVPPMISGPNESVIVVQRQSTIIAFIIPMTLWVDNVKVASLINSGKEARIIIANGEHTIQAGSTNIDKGKAVSFSVVEEQITFFAEPKMGIIFARFKLTQTGKRKL